jgi:hypothetical protein
MDELSEAVDVLALPALYEELASSLSSPSPVRWYCESLEVGGVRDWPFLRGPRKQQGGKRA